MNIIHFDTIDSTNSYAKSHMEELEDGTIILADSQTGGHGQFERKWVDLGAENIYMTFVLKASDKFLPEYVNLTKILADCLCEQIKDMGLNSSIKLPNDVMINGKKVAGILAETVTRGEKNKGVALGIGINLNATSEQLNKIDQPATALNIELGRKIDKNKFKNELINRFVEKYDEIINIDNKPST